MKTIFLLYLSLPQTQGSSYIYVRYLQPFFHYHEDDIDATLVRLKTRIYTFVQEKLQLLWNQIMGSLGQAAAAESTRQPEGSADAAQPPTMADPVSGPAQLLGGLWRTYGPSIVASGAALLRQTGQAAHPSATTTGGTSLFSGLAAAAPAQPQRPHMSGVNRATTESLLERRRQLEAELASLQHLDDSASDSSPERMIPVQHGSSSYLPTSPAGSDADLRSRVAQYEEVEVPSDVEGYDLGGVTRISDSDSNRTGAANRRTSWFGWVSPPATPEKGGKDE